MRRIIFLVSMTLIALVGLSQPVYMTRSGQVSFFFSNTNGEYRSN